MIGNSQESNRNLPEWIITKLNTKEGVRWVIQKLRTDASKPYYLTYRIYRFKVTAEREFTGVVLTETAKENERQQKNRRTN